MIAMYFVAVWWHYAFRCGLVNFCGPVGFGEIRYFCGGLVIAMYFVAVW